MKTVLTEDYIEILRILGESPSSLSLEAILKGFRNEAITKRTLQRKMGELVANDYVKKEGSARATKYSSLHSATQRLESGPLPESGYEAFIPLSPESREILAYVRKPLEVKNPVNYDPSFLEAYEPNVTFYLDELTRAHLRKIGDSGESEQPIGTYGRAILDRLLIDLSWSSSKLEGNTYTRLDTEKLIQQGQEAEGKEAQDAQMILNHKRAIELIVDDAEDIGFNRFSFLNLHGLLSENLLSDQSACGRVRMRWVAISGSAYKPSDIPQLIEEMFHLILHKAEQINDPFEQAFFILVHIPYLQPFEDVNKRVSRVGANISFIKKNLCPLTFLDVPEKAYIESLLGVYEMNRIELYRDFFVWAYERSTKKYIQVKNAIEDPEPIRLKYRNELHELVGEAIRNKVYPYETFVKEKSIGIVEDEYDRDKFSEMVMSDIKNLHEGVLVRYRLKIFEFNEWKKLN